MRLLLEEIGITGLLDIGLMALLIYSLLVWLKRTKRAAATLAGIVIVAFIYLIARQFSLHLTVAVLQGFFAVFLIALVVIFQEELRSFFERVAEWGFSRQLTWRSPVAAAPDSVEMLVATLTDLAHKRIGALVVVRGRDLLVRHLHGGEELGGRVSRAILQSIFDPHSRGHDGAVVIDGELIDQFGCRLPLSHNQKLLGDLGTRHAAALGLSELTDALCLVVSEERGAITIARDGEWISVTDGDHLRRLLQQFYEELHPAHRVAPVHDFIRKNSREKLIALLLAVGMWFVVVHESRIVYRTYRVPVELPPLPQELVVQEFQPKTVRVTLSGLRKDFFLSGPSRLVMVLRSLSLTPGRQQVPLTESELVIPDSLALERIDPPQVTVQLENKVVTTK